jgi:hypothetical protein
MLKGTVMSSTYKRARVSYGLSQPYFNASPEPIVTNSDPKTTNFAPIGTEWINKSTNGCWVLTSVANNTAVWTRTDNASVNAGITWTIEAGVGPIALAANYGYYLTNIAAVALTLPAAATLGSQIYITTANAAAANAGFVISQNANQYVLYNNDVSTVGVGGSVDATNALQQSVTLLLICTVANVEFTIFSSNINPQLV